MLNEPWSDDARFKARNSAEARWRLRYQEVIRRLHLGETTQQISDAVSIKVETVRDVRLRLKETGELS